MQAFDTLKFQVPADAVRGVNWQAFDHTTIENGATGHTERLSKARHNALPVGVASLSYKDGGDFLLTMSAKTLGDDYLTGINLNNFDRALSTLSPVLDIDGGRLLDSGTKMLLCDTTNNIGLAELGGARQEEVCRALMAGRANQRFLTKYYHSTKKLGVEFHGTQQEKNRLICYSKGLDLLKPANKPFMQALRNPAKMLMDANKTIRFETNHTSFKAMRDRFGVAENTLRAVLESKAPVNHNFLGKVLNIKGSKQVELFDQWQRFDGDGEEFELYIGRLNIMRELNFDDVAIMNFYKDLYGDNFKYHYYKRKGSIKQTLARLKAEQEAEPAKVPSLCNLCMDALLKAVA